MVDIQTSATRTLPVFAVGGATAQAAATAGFTDITSAAGDVDSLADTVTHHASPDAGPLLHVAGSVVAGDLAGMLSARGYDVQRTVLYHAIASQALTANTLGRLRQGEFDYILFYSPRTARIFAQLAEKQGFQNDLGRITAVCLSPAVRNALHFLPWQHIMVASEPAHDALMAAIDIKTKN